MGEHNTIIELNGKRYNAITGAYLGKSTNQPVPVAKSAVPRRHGRVVDGVIRSPQNLNHTTKPVTTPTQSASIPAQPPSNKQSIRQHHPKPVNRHQQPPKTLMRHAVQKPNTQLKPNIKPQPPAEVAPKSAASLVPKQSAARVDTVRLDRAQHIRQHRQIRRFHTPQRATISAPAPNTRSAPPSSSTAQAPATPQRPIDVFEAAIAHATSHKQPTPRIARRQQKKRRIVRTIVGLAVFLMLGGGLAWINKSNIELQVASYQADFKASKPSFQLTDYALGPIKHEQGQVVINYYSGDSHYRITQSASNWNSQTLLDNAVAVAGASTEKPNIIESKGRTIYLHNSNNASWVDGGVRYDISGNAPLTESDIRAIADSM